MQLVVYRVIPIYFSYFMCHQNKSVRWCLLSKHIQTLAGDYAAAGKCYFALFSLFLFSVSWKSLLASFDLLVWSSVQITLLENTAGEGRRREWSLLLWGVVKMEYCFQGIGWRVVRQFMSVGAETRVEAAEGSGTDSVCLVLVYSQFPSISSVLSKKIVIPPPPPSLWSLADDFLPHA